METRSKLIRAKIGNFKNESLTVKVLNVFLALLFDKRVCISSTFRSLLAPRKFEMEARS